MVRFLDPEIVEMVDRSYIVPVKHPVDGANFFSIIMKHPAASH